MQEIKHGVSKVVSLIKLMNNLQSSLFTMAHSN